MQAAQVLAGYSLGDADLLRRAMGKKIQSEMDAQRARFVEGCAANDIGEAKATELFDLIDKFAGYGFNKSHAAAYALVAYHTAWLKAHHRPEFYAASMSFDLTQTDKLALFVEDMRRGGVDCLAPDINHSHARFARSRKARCAMPWARSRASATRRWNASSRSAKPKGSSPASRTFTVRIDPRWLNRRQIESLAGAGAFDGLRPDRAAVYAGAETILAHAASAHDQRTSGQAALFGGGGARRRPDPPAARRRMVDGPAHGGRARQLSVSTSPPIRSRRTATCSPPMGSRPLANWPRSGSPRASAPARAWRRWSKTRAGGPRRAGGATDGRSERSVGPVRGDGVRRRCRAPRSRRRRAVRSAGCSSVELDKRAGDDMPRVTVKRFQPLDSLAKRTRLQLKVTIDDPALVPAVARELEVRAWGQWDW